MIKKSLTLEDIYVFAFVKTENGLYRPMTDAEISAIEIKSTGDQIIDALVKVLVHDHVYKCDFVANKLGLQISQINSVCKVFLGMTFKDLLSAYRRRWLLDLVRYTDLKPAEVAKLSGFSSAKSMYVHFTNVEKETFFSYRKRHQINVSETIEKYRVE